MSMNTIPSKERWYTGITRYQWLVLVICLVGWMFDVFEGQIFVAVMPEAIPSFITETDPVLREKQAEFFNQVALVSFLLGGTLGGIVFGMLSDRIGRKQTMAWSILFYSFFTWLTAFSMEWWHLAGLRFFVAIGVGGQWAVASAYVAETFPSKARAHAASLFHAFGSFGTLLAAFVGAMMLGNVAVLTWAETTPLLEWARNIYEPSTLPWRLCFALGLIPSIVVFFIFAYLKEPEKWKAAQERAKQDPTQKVGAITDLFRRDIVRSTIIGVTLAAIGMATFWGVHIRGKDTIRLVSQNQMVAEGLVPFGTEIVTEIVDGEEIPVSETVIEIGLDGEAVETVKEIIRETERRAFSGDQFAELKRWEMLGMVLATLGLLFGQLSFGPLSQRIGRRGAFVFFHIGGFLIAIFVFQVTPHLTSVVPLYFLLPIFGFLTAGMYSGYAVYFPELFPSRLRGTGVGFCFNMGRFMASPFLLITGWMVSYSGFTLLGATTILSFLYLLGPVVILFARETRGTELTE